MATPDHYHGDPSIYGAFRVASPARPRGAPAPALPDSDPDNPIVVMRSDRYPELQGVFWLLSGRGRGREAMLVDRQGNVSPRLMVDDIHIGTPDVEPSKLDPQDLDLRGYLHRMLTMGWVRVDHLQDAEGEPLGFPSDEIRSDRTMWRDWAWRVLDVARLRQLASELDDAEPGRKLNGAWAPRLRMALEMKMRGHKGKTTDEAKHGSEIADTAQRYLDKAGARMRAAVNPRAPTPEPGKPQTPDAIAVIFNAHEYNRATPDETRAALMLLPVSELREAAKAVGVDSRGGVATLTDKLIIYLADHKAGGSKTDTEPTP